MMMKWSDTVGGGWWCRWNAAQRERGKERNNEWALSGRNNIFRALGADELVGLLE